MTEQNTSAAQSQDAEENVKIDLHGHDPQNITKPGKDTRFITAFPDGYENAKIVKFLHDPRKRQSYVPVTSFKHQIGPDPQKDIRMHPSLRSLGLAEHDPEADFYWDNYEKLKELRNLGKGESEEAKKLNFLGKQFAPNDRGWFFFIEPDSETVQVIRAPKAILNRIFGKKATKYRPEVPSLLKEMSHKGLSPYDLKSSEGWVKLWKTGKGIATEYHMEMYTLEEQREIDGQKAIITKNFKAMPGKKIINNELMMSDFPNPLKFEERNAFTLEEAIQFANSGGTIVPERFTKRTDETDEPGPDGEESSTPVVSVDDIPL